MENLKKLYFKVKVQSREFKIPLGETYTGDELFYTILEFQKNYTGEEVPAEDQKWFNKLVYYLGPFPGTVNERT